MCHLYSVSGLGPLIGNPPSVPDMGGRGGGSISREKGKLICTGTY